MKTLKDLKNVKNIRDEFKNIRELIYNSAEQFGEENAFVIKRRENDYENVTYKRFLEDINRLGTAFFDMNLSGKRVAIVGKNRYEWALTHITNLAGGIVSVPLDKELEYEELKSSLIRSKSDAIVFDVKYLDKIEKLKNEQIGNLKEFICMDVLDGYKSIEELIALGDKLLKEGKKEYLDAPIDENKMAILLFTSGTTEMSKAVMLSQRNITANVYAMQDVEVFYASDVNIALLPYHHIFGSTAMVKMLSHGIETVFADGLRHISKNFKEYKVSVFVGVPLIIEAMYKKIMKEIEKQGKTGIIKIAKFISGMLLKVRIDIRRKIFKKIIDQLGGNMRFIISGGAPLDKEVAKGFNAFGINLIQGYGLTETSPVISAENTRCIKAGTVGYPLRNMEVEIINKDEKGIGEIRVKGPSVMLGYYENQKVTDEVLKDGWFYTGDLAYTDNKGRICITGREKDMIVLKNGKKIFPEEIECLVNKLDLVKESFVFGLPDKDNDVKLSVEVVYDEDTVQGQYNNVEKEELEKIIWNQIKELNKTLPKYKYIKNMILTDEELIKTSTKKIKRREEMKKILR